jgi:peptidoglycan/xylan/chitin deacetylase (PgdA/CDA1 family)
MRVAARHIAVVLGLAVAVAYLLQTDDSARLAASPAPAAVALQPVLVNSADPGGRDYFVSRHVQEVVPLGARSISLPILMYHYIRPAPSMRTDLLGYRLSVTPENFALQMDWLYAHGYHAVNFNDVRAYFAGQVPLPAKPVIITLDDGYRDLYTSAYPILMAHRFTAVAYIVTSFVDQQPYVTAGQVVEMDRAGIEIASHTINHASLAGRASFASDMVQLVQSRQWLEHLVGHPVLDFAYPSGQFNAVAVAAVRSAGYYSAVTEITSTVHSEADRYTWTRVRVGGGESMSDFIANLGSCMPSVQVTTRVVDVEEGAPRIPRQLRQAVNRF